MRGFRLIAMDRAKSEKRAERLSQALRANLTRRKAEARARQTDSTGERPTQAADGEEEGAGEE